MMKNSKNQFYFNKNVDLLILNISCNIVTVGALTSIPMTIKIVKLYHQQCTLWNMHTHRSNLQL